MKKQDYITKGTLTASQVQFRKDYWNRYHSTRRKLNIIGGIICGAIVYKAIPYMHIDLSQPLTSDDTIKIMAAYMLLLFTFRLIRQKFQAAFTPTDLYDADVQKAIEELTPQQAEQILKEDSERMDAYPKDKAKSNSFAFILCIATVCVVYYALKVKGV